MLKFIINLSIFSIADFIRILIEIVLIYIALGGDWSFYNTELYMGLFCSTGLLVHVLVTVLNIVTL